MRAGILILVIKEGAEGVKGSGRKFGTYLSRPSLEFWVVPRSRVWGKKPPGLVPDYAGQ